jgi:predicted transcriptional regulator
MYFSKCCLIVSSVSSNITYAKAFRPSAVMLLRIMKVLLDKNSVGRTELALETKVQYKRLVMHLKWLGEREVVEMIVNNDIVNVALTDKGRDFASMLLTIYGLEQSN